MEQKKERENSRQVHPSAMAGNDTNLQLSSDTYNSVSKEVEADLTESGGDDEVLSNILSAPENPTVDVNSIYEPPIYGLPQRVQDLITDICAKKQVPTEFVLSPLLAVAGTAAGLNSVLDGRSYENSPCFWCVVVADPGSNKSYPQKLICNPLNRINTELSKVHDADLREWRAECAAISKGAKDKANAVQPPRPLKCRIRVEDTTREALAEILVGSPNGVCQIRDELSGWLGDIGRYGKSGEISTYLSYWSGEGTSIDRKGEDGTAIVDSVLYNICGTIQPGILADSFTNQHLTSGFVHRFMFFWPQVIPQKRIERNPISPDTTIWDNIVGTLYQLRTQNIRLTLNDAANEIAMDYEQELEEAKYTPTVTAYEKGVLSKLDIIMLRLACVARMLAIADGDASHEVTEQEMRWASDLCRYLRQTQMRVYETLQFGKNQRPLTDAELIRLFMLRFASKGVSQGALAKLLKTSQPYISQCVNPKSKGKEQIESE